MKAPWARLAWWCLPVVYAAFLATPSIRLPGDDAGLRRFRTPPLGPDLRLGQTFTMPSDGLSAIEVFPARVGDGVSGTVRLELYEVRNAQLIPVHAAAVPAADLVRGPSYLLEFAPLPDSRERTYRLDLVGPAVEGVAFWATRGERYGGGRMHANGRDRWADLTFRAYAPAPSVWSRLMTLRDSNPARAYTALAALTALWLLLGPVVRALA